MGNLAVTPPTDGSRLTLTVGMHSRLEISTGLKLLWVKYILFKMYLWYLVLTRMPGESYRRRLMTSWRALINSLVCRSCSAEGKHNKTLNSPRMGQIIIIKCAAGTLISSACSTSLEAAVSGHFALRRQR